jgi:predicted phosphodiesterase
VISGHSHKPLVEQRRGVLFLNPGSAGPRRFQLPVSVAWLETSAEGLTARIVHLPL